MKSMNYHPLDLKQWLIASQKCVPQNHPCYFHRVTVSNQNDYNDFENQISHTMEIGDTVCGSNCDERE